MRSVSINTCVNGIRKHIDCYRNKSGFLVLNDSNSEFVCYSEFVC